LWKPEAIRNFDLWTNNLPGALAGEGSAYFIISGVKTDTSYARLEAVETLYKPGSTAETASFVNEFLSENGLSSGDVDVVLMGNNGHTEHDRICNEVISRAIPLASRVLYKHLCGEYHTVSGFALFLASNMIRREVVPSSLVTLPSVPKKIETILIHNHFRDTDHAFILVRK